MSDTTRVPDGDVKVHWFLPTSGDGRSIVEGSHASRSSGTADAFRFPTLDYLTEVARAADRLGYEAVLTPTGTWCEDAWLVTAALISQTSRLKFLVAFRPGVVSPTLAAQMAATYQRLSGGRLVLNVVTGGDGSEQRRFGDWLDHDERYDRTREFLEVVRGVWSGTPLDYDGRHYRVRDARVSLPPTPVPQVYFGGSSDAALPVAAEQADVYLTWGEPPAQAKAKIDEVRRLAAERGRELRFGVRLHVITRDTSEEAWAVAQRFVDRLTPEQVQAARTLFQGSASVGQQRMTALNGAFDGTARSLEIHPGLWAGVGLVRGGAGTALVGSHEEVADLVAEYHAAGFDEFVLSGYPHLEEAYWFGEGVRPLLDARGLTTPAAPTGPTGEALTRVVV
ncbi:LLM class flavin-dependent oxidoreductase [Luteimicrobium subarcticum]|uniref:Alkanesulfonate monooxygenase n=1 Tax=Luteimicrobium subarcticum TaxID=620910 RepID=A0A2M8WVL2_9MICO|nr:LLM class flavin-dependent oxidoreductase [Luteimicrobium subarcticum]PJI94953.1 alkanesulfonate monooxygenase [Luteimicrobium subarcticum]